jgi:Chaperone of endosialidase
MAIDFPNSPTAGEIFERWRWDTDKWIPNASTSTPYLPLSGGVMSGPIVLAGNAATNLEAVPLQQLNSRLALYLPLTGGALSGSLSVTGTMVATGLVQGNPVNSTGDLTAGGNIGTNNVVYAGAVQTNTFYANPTFTGSITVNGNISTANGVYAALVQTPTLSGSVTVTGSLQVNGNIGCNNTIFATGAVQTPQLNGNVYVTGNLNSGGQVQGNTLYSRSGIDAVGYIAAGSQLQSTRNDGYALYAPYGGVTVAGNGSIGNQLNIGGNCYANYFQSNTGVYAAGQVTGNPIVSNGDASVANILYAHDVMPTVDNGGICGGAASAWNTVESYYFATKSDRALKEILGPLPDTLPMVLGLDPQAFQYTSGDARRNWGFVAQDVQAAAQDYPVDIVRGEEGYLSVDYNALTAALWRAVQTIDTRLKALEGA